MVGFLLTGLCEPSMVYTMDITDVFEENHYSSDNSEEDEDEEDIGLNLSKNAASDPEASDEDDSQLDISRHQARLNYNMAGSFAEEESDQISVKNYGSYISKSVDSTLNEVTKEVDLSYELADFQRIAINVIGSKKSLILVSPTGSGKMSVPLLATLVLRKELKVNNGVCIVTQPLSSIMNEKLHNNICGAAVLSMTGVLKTSSSGDNAANKDNAQLSCSLTDLFNGKFPVIFCHPESVESKLGLVILRELQKREMLILICIDEFHQGGKGYWESFRPNMMSSSASLRRVIRISSRIMFPLVKVE